MKSTFSRVRLIILIKFFNGNCPQPLNALPDIIVRSIEARVSAQRINIFLKSPSTTESERPEKMRVFPLGGGVPAEPPVSVHFREAKFRWTSSRSSLDLDLDYSDMTISSAREDYEFRLELDQVTFPAGKLSIVCGPTGCGKSSLIQAILGGM
jgi:ABC-type multidrug transport system fused ATPase/permease subunit